MLPTKEQIAEIQKRADDDEAFYKTQADLGKLLREYIRSRSHSDRAQLLEWLTEALANQRTRGMVELCERYEDTSCPFHAHYGQGVNGNIGFCAFDDCPIRHQHNTSPQKLVPESEMKDYAHLVRHQHKGDEK